MLKGVLKVIIIPYACNFQTKSKSVFRLLIALKMQLHVQPASSHTQPFHDLKWIHINLSVI